jgi:hypothetical protein
LPDTPLLDPRRPLSAQHALLEAIVSVELRHFAPLDHIPQLVHHSVLNVPPATIAIKVASSLLLALMECMFCIFFTADILYSMVIK